ncbi:peptide MFS transporter [Legionella dresdenensis]|uniref:Peptide MFS transporter n=1 Tax=Legionella dresdenensis TaxID=450200 RepID=A0ABV8CCC3_9GAMM
MVEQAVNNFLPLSNIRQKQSNNIALITFWSQFSVYALNTILILFLTRPFLEHGLGYSQAQAYAFIGVTQATGYLMPVLGGFMADQVVGVRRAILFGSVMLAFAYLLVMLSGYTVGTFSDKLFIAAYALVPATNSLLMGTASGLISRIYSDDAIQAKSAMTWYYMAINVGALLATFIAPALLDSRFGPLSVLTVTFIGKSIAALNFARNYHLYDNVIIGKDKLPMTAKTGYKLLAYIAIIYLFTLLAYSHIYLASIVIGTGCALGIVWFFIKTLILHGEQRTKQLMAIFLILEAIIFFIIYNQMNSTMVLFAKNNSDLQLVGFSVSSAHYQLLNPLLIIALSFYLPGFYSKFPRFTIPYQFAAGTLLAGAALLIMVFAARHAHYGLVNGNYIALTYVFITLAELWVSAIGLSMIGLYCDQNNMAFAMGVWYLASALSNAISGRLAALVAIPEHITNPEASLLIYQHYYWWMGLGTIAIGCVMLLIARLVQTRLARKGINLA